MESCGGVAVESYGAERCTEECEGEERCEEEVEECSGVQDCYCELSPHQEVRGGVDIHRIIRTNKNLMINVKPTNINDNSYTKFFSNPSLKAKQAS